MASSVDALIARGVQAPQIENPLDLQAKRVSLMGAQQQLQEGAIKLQQARQDQHDQQVFMQAWQQTGDMEKALPIAMQQGVSPKFAMGVTQQITAMQEQHAKLDETQLKNRIGHSEQIGGQLNAISQDPNRAQPGVWEAIVKQAEDMHDVPRGTLPAQYPGDDWVKAHTLANLELNKQLQNEQKNREIKAQEQTAQSRADAAATGKEREAREREQFNLQAPGMQAKAEQDARANDSTNLLQAFQQGPTVYQQALDALPHGRAKAFPVNPQSATEIVNAGLNPEQLKTTTQTAERDANTAANQAQERKDSEKRIALEQQRVWMEQKKFNATIGAGLDANGRPLSPEDQKTMALQDPTAQAIANYQLPAPSPRSLTNPQSKATMAKVLAIDPNYDATKFPVRNKVALDFSAGGKSGQAITAADTALAHLNRISVAGQALKNGDIKVLNSIANQIGAQTGTSAPQVYDAIVSMVAPEVSKAVIGAAGGEQERQAMQKNFASNTNDQTREQTIGAAAQLLSERVHKMAQAYQADMEKPLKRQLSPESQQMLQRYSGAPGTGAAGTAKPRTATDANGKKVQWNGSAWVPLP